MREYRFNTEGPEILARVTPTLEALGDQPWRVQLVDAIDGLSITDGGFYEAPSALQAATDAVEEYLVREGYKNTSFAVSL